MIKSRQGYFYITKHGCTENFNYFTIFLLCTIKMILINIQYKYAIIAKKKNVNIILYHNLKLKYRWSTIFRYSFSSFLHFNQIKNFSLYSFPLIPLSFHLNEVLKSCQSYFINNFSLSIPLLSFLSPSILMKC